MASPCKRPPSFFGHEFQAPMGAYSGDYGTMWQWRLPVKLCKITMHGMLSKNSRNKQIQIQIQGWWLHNTCGKTYQTTLVHMQAYLCIDLYCSPIQLDLYLGHFEVCTCIVKLLLVMHQPFCCPVIYNCPWPPFARYFSAKLECHSSAQFFIRFFFRLHNFSCRVLVRQFHIISCMYKYMTWVQFGMLSWECNWIMLSTIYGGVNYLLP